jgi:hypothetical protein
MVDPKKIANNILDFLIDPTKIPVQERVYFRPEEKLKNEIYETTKADVAKAYKDQKHNSDFYPSKNRQMREATLMDRKSLIASFDILSRNFKENDPIGKDLRTMAAAVAKMKDEELATRQASDAPDFDGMAVEAKGKAATFPCPKCGTKVLEATSYCIKCKKKVKPGKKAADEEPAKDAPKDEEPAKEKEPEVKKDDEVEASDFWTKEAMTRVAKGLLSDVIGMSQDEEEAAPAKKKEDEVESKKKEEEVESKKAPKEEMDEKDAAKAKKDEDEKMDYAAKKKEEEVEAAKKAALPVEEKPEEELPKDEEKKSTVDTDILASITFGDISMDAPIIEAGEMTEEEKAKLAGLFN